MQKQVKIIGFELKQALGLLKAHKLDFDKNNKLIIFKGSVGQGKTTEQKAIQLSTQGNKTLTDKQLYGNSVNTEVQLLDGDVSVWVGCKSNKNGDLIYSLYTKDDQGKIIREPVLDGMKATPSKYLETLQTELTWKMDELTSENPTVQKNILLSLYQHQLSKLGVIMDKKHPGYKDGILGKIEDAEERRNSKDAIRKQTGGIAEDLKANGFDPDRPATIPDFIDITDIDNQIKEQEKQRTIKETESLTAKNQKMQEIKTKGAELVLKCKDYNTNLKGEFDELIKGFEKENNKNNEIKSTIKEIEVSLNRLLDLGVYDEKDVMLIMTNLKHNIHIKKLDEPKKPEYIEFNQDNIILLNNFDLLLPEGKKLLNEIKALRQSYSYIEIQKNKEVDLSEFDSKIKEFEEKKSKANEINKIVNAVDSFHKWRKADDEVKHLKKEYAKLLAQVDTGVEGLKIVPEESDGKFNIFLMYNGEYDPKYFNNTGKEYRKLSSYSGTQKPVICLLIQNYLLNIRTKAMRYMFIDNIPMDKKTVELLRNMCEKLDLTVFLNITGDFTQDEIQKGEILIEGGEVLFN